MHRISKINSKSNNRSVAQLFGDWVRFPSTKFYFHEPHRYNVLLVRLGVLVLEQEEEHANFQGDEQNGEENNKSHISNLVYGVVAHFRGTPFGTSIHDKPNNVQNNACHN